MIFDLTVTTQSKIGTCWTTYNQSKAITQNTLEINLTQKFKQLHCQMHKATQD